MTREGQDMNEKSTHSTKNEILSCVLSSLSHFLRFAPKMRALLFKNNRQPTTNNETHHTSTLHPPPLSNLNLQSPLSLQSTQLGSTVETALPEAEKAHIP
jgi:hypothetical protein